MRRFNAANGKAWFCALSSATPMLQFVWSFAKCNARAATVTAGRAFLRWRSTRRFDPSIRSGVTLVRYRLGTIFFGTGFHSRARFCASAIWSGVMRRAIRSRIAAAPSLPCVAAKLNHM